MEFTAVKLVKTRNLHPELDAAIQSFASNLTEDVVAVVSQKERGCFAQDSRNMTNDVSVFKDRYGEPVVEVCFLSFYRQDFTDDWCPYTVTIWCTW